MEIATAAIAIMAIALLAAVLALAALASVLAWIVYRRFGQQEVSMADDLAGRVIDAFNNGFETRKRLEFDIADTVKLETETRMRRQHFAPKAQSLADVMTSPDDDEPVTVATFGERPIAEMHTAGYGE